MTSKGNIDGMVIKYSSDGEVEWATSVGGTSGDYIESVAGTAGGIIVGGYFYSSSIQVGEYTLTSKGSQAGMVIKYNKEGKVEWISQMAGRTNAVSTYIQSVAETADGGIMVGGSFEGTIQIGKYTLKSKTERYNDGILIKYSKEGEVEWINQVEGTGEDRINPIVATADGGIIAGGYFQGTIQIGKYTLTMMEW